MFSLDRQQILRVPAWQHYDWLDAGFGTRHTTDWPPLGQTASVKQIHSDILWTTDGQVGQLGEGDGLVSATTGVYLLVKTADCLPVLLVDPVQRAVSAVHAGWRGTVAGISAKAVQMMGEHYGSQPQNIQVALGPAIGACCFEVGPEVAQQFAALFPERRDLQQKTMIDLAEANARQLEQAGVYREQIMSARRCTKHEPQHFHSFRRDREDAGRLIAAIRLT